MRNDRNDKVAIILAICLILIFLAVGIYFAWSFNQIWTN